eukprot:3200698-Rhodomonas_salina.1
MRDRAGTELAYGLRHVQHDNVALTWGLRLVTWACSIRTRSSTLLLHAPTACSYSTLLLHAPTACSYSTLLLHAPS